VSRHLLVLLFGLAAMTSVAVAQQPARVPVVGLFITHPPVNDPVVEALRKGLRQFGYEDGRNIQLEVRTAQGQMDRVPGIAEELVRLPVDVIVVGNEVALRATREATSSIPIVMIGFNDDPLALGWINSYARPGGNVTGTYNVNSALISKRLEIVRQTLPNVSRVAVLWDTFGRRQLEELRRAAEPLGVQLQLIELGGAQDLEAAFKTAKRKKAGAMLLVWSPVFYVQQTKVAALGLAAGLPVFTDLDTLAEAGALLSYGSDRDYNLACTAYFVDRVLKGAKPADLPVEQISKLKLVVNLKTAKALGLAIPESILVRADEVIR
jgi:putative ABC transport system substrate-binding protein